MENKLVQNTTETFNNGIAKQILEKLLTRVKINENDKEFLARPFTIESFYKSCFYNIDDTVNDLADCIKWRNNELVNGIDKYCIDNTTSIIKFINKKNDVPVIYISSFYGHDDIRSLIFYGITIVEDILKSKKYTTYDLIFDCYKSKMSHYTDISGMKYFIEIFKKYYPFRINRLLMINSNQISYNLVNICKPFFSIYMKDRIFPIKDHNIELSDYFNQEILDFLNMVKNEMGEPLILYKNMNF